jgi:hypothetical protein
MSEDKQPSPDQAAAHEFLSELRTRISTHPLPYQYGVESRALESLWEVFEHARTAMKNHPGCETFAHRTTEMLNLVLRPVTAKWHRAHNEGRLNSRDGGNEFRADLEAVQTKLREFADELHEMAYDGKREDSLTPFPMDDMAVAAVIADLPFGIPQNALIEDNQVVAKINEKEAEEVKTRRGNYEIPNEAPTNAVGLGLSGGGIRSATFCLGVIQVLAERGLLKHVDFLSTVSGGGYIGCFLIRRLDSKEAQRGVAAPHGPDPKPIRFLRQRAKYLSVDNLKGRWAMVTATFAGMVLNWCAPLFLVALAASIAVTIPDGVIPWRAILLLMVGATLVSMLIYAFRMRYWKYSGGALLGWTTAATLFVAFLWLLTRAYGSVIGLQIPPGWKLSGSAIIASAITAFPSIVRFIPVLRNPAVRDRMLKLVLLLAGLIVPLGAIALSFWFYYLGRNYAHGWVMLSALTLLFAAVAIFLLNINLTGPHRLYRDQLARTFIHLQDDELQPVALHTVNPNGFAPYHLINATANLPSSTDVKLRERRSDFFLFSKHWCGAPSIGYTATANWRAGRDTTVDLATAMAVSGAAASPYMGLGSFPTLTAILTFLNVRLGYWIRRPGIEGAATRRLGRICEALRLKKPEQQDWIKLPDSATPGFLCLMREMLGIQMSEKESWINLSDGGHIENMAIYELLRRRCKFIISVDGEADPQSTFHGHLTLVRHAQIDFGIRIEPNLTALRPDLTSKFSQSHIMMCRIHYPAAGNQPAGIGLILYLKLSVTGNELELIKRYRALHPDFPHQSTLDQFFDEEQFEAYRQLGVHVAEGLFLPALVGSGPAPTTMKDWFGRLSRRLLLPENWG